MVRKKKGVKFEGFVIVALTCILAKMNVSPSELKMGIDEYKKTFKNAKM